jgi:hypothetical protein
MRSSSLRLLIRGVLPFIVLTVGICAQTVSAQGKEGAKKTSNVVMGTLDKVDAGAKTVAVKTADDTVTVVKFTAHTTVSGLKGAAHGADLVGKEDGHVIVHYIPEGTEKTAHAIVFVGDQTVHATEGTITDIGKGTKTVAVKTADGTEETFRVADHATIDTAKGVGHYTVVGAKKGEHVTVYYTEEAGKKIAHAFMHL